MLGFASQLPFGFLYAAVLVWSAWRAVRGDGAMRRAMLACHVPPTVAALAAGALAVAAALALDVGMLRRRGSDLWVLDVAAIVPPVVLVAVFPPAQLYPRYLLMSIAMLLVVLGGVLGDLLGRPGAPRALAATAVAVVCAGNVARLVPFLRDGRGHYAETLRWAAERTVSRLTVRRARAARPGSRAPRTHAARRSR